MYGCVMTSKRMLRLEETFEQEKIQMALTFAKKLKLDAQPENKVVELIKNRPHQQQDNRKIEKADAMHSMRKNVNN
ncbi:hypothetical protein FOA43_000402 [Brettanomyces nanus]|uniref:Uncharacterized protein n=1 Tax=Eeniella nana TaxID=13502 RepID=A0A875RT27_EENNA|nr:uncharacterized protein FOA43_000402 [Brettanomyces nanus]QPG73097.1 hypothetical protein FOA43_000402 [Brettanomyces nanus]